MSNALETIKAILSEKLSDNEVHTLIAEFVIASGKGSVALTGNAAESIIMTGSNNNVNRIYQGLDVEEIKELLKVLQQSETSNPSSSTIRENAQLRKITFNVETIDFINSRLEILGELQKNRELSEEQSDEFALLKQKVEAANELDQKLKEIEIIAERILEQSIISLAAKIESLKRESDQELSGIHEEIKLDQEAACLEKQIHLVKKFQINLAFGKQGAAWLNSNIPEFTRIIGKYALCQFIEIQETASEDEIDNFYFSIEQLLERISHCLAWGRYSVLDSFDIPLIFDPKIHEFAFSFFKDTIIPPHLPTEVRKQLEDHINYLIRRLPLYPR